MSGPDRLMDRRRRRAARKANKARRWLADELAARLGTEFLRARELNLHRAAGFSSFEIFARDMVARHMPVLAQMPADRLDAAVRAAIAVAERRRDHGQVN